MTNINSTKRAFLFPGQGSQYVGMGKDLFDNSPEAKEMFLIADDVLGINLSSILFNGPEDELKQTEYTQPAIFLHSVILAALIRTLDADCSAGHSLGEYSALVSAGALQFQDALKLVRARGLAMQKAGVQSKGTMAAVLGLKPQQVEECCSQASAEGIVQCANFNSPGQIVISGSVAGVKKCMELCKTAGAKLVKELVVSGAFHSPLMLTAQAELKNALNETNFNDAKFPVYANVTALPVTDKGQVKELLYAQLTSPVKWEDSIKNMISGGCTEFYEIGPGKVLQGLVKRINPDVQCFGIDKFSDVEKFL